MPLIDEDGRLFDVVNIIDALVILFALAGAVAGVALVTGESTSAEEAPTQTVIF